MLEIIWALSFWYLIPSIICLVIFIISAFYEAPVGLLFFVIAGSILFFGIPANSVNITLYDFSVGLVSYILIGLIWSFFRYFKEATQLKSKGYNIEQVRSNIQNSLIATWIMYWPFGFISYIIGDFFNNIVEYVAKRFKGVYNKILESVFK